MPLKPVILRFQFKKFEALSLEAYHEVASEIQRDCKGNKWCLKLWPAGRSRADEREFILFGLNCTNKESIDCKLSLLVKNAAGAVEKRSRDKSRLIQRCFIGRWLISMERSRILDPANKILRNGNLYVDVIIQVKESNSELYIPPNNLSSRMLTLMRSGENADASVEVAGKKIPVHYAIICANSPMLASYCTRYNASEGSDGHALEVAKDADVFRLLLEHVYTGNYPSNEDILKHGED